MCVEDNSSGTFPLCQNGQALEEAVEVLGRGCAWPRTRVGLLTSDRGLRGDRPRQPQSRAPARLGHVVP